MGSTLSFHPYPEFPVAEAELPVAPVNLYTKDRRVPQYKTFSVGHELKPLFFLLAP
jgi:hypothetical protein